MYTFTFRRRLSPLKTTIKNCAGHSYDPSTDKMWVAYATGGGREVLRWRECEAYLGADWKAFADKFTSKVGKPALVE